MEALCRSHFARLVDTWVRQALGENCRSFGDLVSRLPGVFPTTVLESLRYLAAAGSVPNLQAKGLAAQAKRAARSSTMGLASDGLPVPHPLDFDWRFTDEAAEVILSEAHLLSRHRGTIGFVGAPSVALKAGSRWAPQAVIAFDIALPILSALKRGTACIFTYECNVLTDEPPVAGLDVLVTDPPWYFDELFASLAFCHAACRVGGFVLASLPPIGTRPGIPEERALLINAASRLGLDLVRIEPARLPYRSPPFEQNSLRAAGVIGTPVDWRRGDLAIFAKTISRVPRVKPRRTQIHPQWSEVSFHGVRLKFRPQEASGFTDPRLFSLIEGDILPSVSRRDPRRDAAKLWTSGNRVLGCLGSDILLTVGRALGSGFGPLASVERHLGRRLSPMESRMTNEAATQLMRVVLTEEEELYTYAGEGREKNQRVFAS